MPTTGELITTAYVDVLDVGADAADSLDFRSRILLHLRRAVSAFWAYRSWPFTFGSGDCSALAGDSSMFVPADFSSFGPYTKLWRFQSPGLLDSTPLTYRQPLVIRNRLQAYGSASADRPDEWTFLGQGKVENPTAPTVVVNGAPGVTPYAYKIVALRGSNHTSVSLATAITTGNAVLSGVNFNRITWTAVVGADSYDVYRTTGGTNAPELIATGLTTLAYNDVLDDGGGPDTPPNSNTTFSKLIVFAPKLSTDTDFQLVDYRMKDPVLVDEYIIAPADVVGGEGDTLKLIPEQYHESVLLEEVRRRLMSDEGDDREPVVSQEFMLALRDAWCEENSTLLGGEAFPPGYYGSSSVFD